MGNNVNHRQGGKVELKRLKTNSVLSVCTLGKAVSIFRGKPRLAAGANGELSGGSRRDFWVFSRSTDTEGSELYL